MSSYVVRHGKSGFRYKRKVPKHLRDAVGAAVWVEYLGSAMNFRGAEAKARPLARRDDQRIALLDALKPEERKRAVADGVLDVVGTSGREIKALENSIPFIEAIARHTAVSVNGTREDRAEQALEIEDSRRDAQAARRRITLKRKALGKLSGRRATNLDVLVETWISANKPKAVHTVDAMWHSVRNLTDTVGNLHPRNVTKDHAGKYRDRVDKTDLSPRTKRKYVEQLNTLFSTAQSERLIDANPFHKIKVGKTGGKFVDEEGQEPFEPHHVRMIFDALPGEHPDFQWVTKLFAYHGGRSGEFAQLRKEDVTVSFGIPVLKLHDRHGTIKNRQSVRTIPLHPACTDFIAYAEAAEGPWVFASFPLWRSGRRGAPYQRRATDFIRKVVKISDPALTMHSLRHTWITLARDVDMPPAVEYGMTGHALGRGAHGRYGRPPSLKKQLHWLEKIDPLKG